MPAKKSFVSQKILNHILKFYGGRIKYEEHVAANREPCYEFIYREKKNKGRWLTIQRKSDSFNKDINIEVHLCDDEGCIIKRDKWIVYPDKTVEFLNVSTEGKGCKSVW